MIGFKFEVIIANTKRKVKRTMKKTKVILHKDYQISPVDPRIFGGFLEHMGRAVYQGVYDPESAHADSDGFRKDVLQAM